jgi:uncharacterized protein YmfQ (DUF2313 family)
MLELKTLKTLLPSNSRAWWVREGYFLDLLTGLAQTFETVRLWFEKIKQNSAPETADETLPEWYVDYNLEYNSSDYLEVRRQKLSARVYQLGASNKNYILSILKKAGLININIQEGIFSDDNVCGKAVCGKAVCGNFFSYYNISSNYYAYYIVYGTVENQEQLITLQNILQEIVKCILEPIYVVTII